MLHWDDTWIELISTPVSQVLCFQCPNMCNHFWTSRIAFDWKDIFPATLTVLHHNYCGPGYSHKPSIFIHNWCLFRWSVERQNKIMQEPTRSPCIGHTFVHEAAIIPVNSDWDHNTIGTKVYVIMNKTLQYRYINAVMTIIIIIMMILAMLSATWQRREREQEKKGWRKARRMTCIIVVWGQQGEGMGN